MEKNLSSRLTSLSSTSSSVPTANSKLGFWFRRKEGDITLKNGIKNTVVGSYKGIKKGIKGLHFMVLQFLIPLIFISAFLLMIIKIIKSQSLEFINKIINPEFFNKLKESTALYAIALTAMIILLVYYGAKLISNIIESFRRNDSQEDKRNKKYNLLDSSKNGVIERVIYILYVVKFLLALVLALFKKVESISQKIYGYFFDGIKKALVIFNQAIVHIAIASCFAFIIYDIVQTYRDIEHISLLPNFIANSGKNLDIFTGVVAFFALVFIVNLVIDIINTVRIENNKIYPSDKVDEELKLLPRVEELPGKAFDSLYEKIDNKINMTSYDTTQLNNNDKITYEDYKNRQINKNPIYKQSSDDECNNMVSTNSDSKLQKSWKTRISNQLSKLNCFQSVH